MSEPIHLSSLSPLYEAVQSSGIFPDSKFFPDCTLKTNPEEILKAYEQVKDQAGFDLKAFVERHFEFPETPESGYQSGKKPIWEHLEGLWDVLLRKPSKVQNPTPKITSLLPLPYPYIVPGGRFREVYYWDSYFTMLGLQVSGRTELIEQMVDNFAHLIENFGHIPNGNRTYYLSRSQPPFFALMVHLLMEVKGEKTLKKYARLIEKEYYFWMDGYKFEYDLDKAPRVSKPLEHRRLIRLPDGNLLNRYWDDDPSPRPEAYIEDLHTATPSARPEAETYRHLRAAAESGWDFSSRWLKDEQHLATIHTCDFLPVDLNCLLYFLEKNIALAYQKAPYTSFRPLYKKRLEKRKEAILKYCWDAQKGFFFDYNFVENRRSNSYTLAGVFPLFFQIATPEQAARVAQVLDEKFLRPGGLVTTLSHSGQQWDAPNGWAPLQWIAYQGLMHYGHTDLAAKIRHNWLTLCEKTYAETGKMMEKYDVENPEAPGGGGEYPNQDGFGWTNGVYLKMKTEL